MTQDTDIKQALLEAADAARFAPSVHNTQPWRWVVHPDRLELFAVPDRQLKIQDPEGHMLLTSCGTALQHARVALTAAGWRVEVERPAGEPLAVVRPTGREPADPAAGQLLQQLKRRHTDRRTVGDERLPAEVLDRLVAATEADGGRLHVLNRDQVIELAVIVERAQKTEASDDLLRAETSAWVGGDRADGTGIPDATLPEELPRTTIAERDFGTSGTLDAGAGHDTTASYAVLYGPGDEAADWLRAGEALSALWLAATAEGAGLLPLSTPVEVPFTRMELRRMLRDIGFPYLVLRLGRLAESAGGPGRTPRLPTEQVIEVRD